MKAHFFFSVFTEDGRAYGKADLDAELAVLPPVGEYIDLHTIASKRDGQIKIDLRVTRIESRANYIGIELSDVVATTENEAHLLCEGLRSLGFDCDEWE